MSGANGRNGGHDRDLARSLAAELRAVAIVPRLRARVTRFAGVGAVVGAVLLLAVGLRPDLTAQATALDVWSSIFAGLLLVCLSATVATLASSVPGRELPLRVASWILACALAALALAPPVAGGLLGGGWAHVGHATPPLSADLGCLLRGVLFALLPGAALFAFAAAAAPLSAHRTAALAGIAAVAVGATVVHLSCPASGVRHLWLAHGLAPLAGAGLGLVGTRWLSRWRHAGVTPR